MAALHLVRSASRMSQSSLQAKSQLFFSPPLDLVHASNQDKPAHRSQEGPATAPTSSPLRAVARTVHTFGHPSSGGPLVMPHIKVHYSHATLFAEIAGEHARRVSLNTPAATTSSADLYGETFGERVPF